MMTTDLRRQQTSQKERLIRWGLALSLALSHQFREAVVSDNKKNSDSAAVRMHGHEHPSP